jgi:internalin A
MSKLTKLLGGADQAGQAEAAKPVPEEKELTPMEQAQQSIKQAGESGATMLDLSNLGLATLPPALADLTGLETLNLNGNPLKEWPAWLARLGKLQRLYLVNCGLHDLPTCITQLERLAELYLNHNQLCNLPPELAQTSKLATINLGNNAFTHFPAVLLACPRLTTLYIHANRLTALPAAIDQLAGLSRLVISDNQCITLPESLGNLAALQYLDVASNGLQALPESIAALQALHTLRANGNHLATLPNGIAQCQKLAEIDLANNQLHRLPPHLAALPLTHLCLQGNPALGLADALLGEYIPFYERHITAPRDPQGILAAYYALQTKDGLALNEIKLVLVGRGFAGKTSLVRRLVHGDFNHGQPQTLGIDIKPWHINLAQTDDDKQNPVKVNIWDFAGQVITHATHQFFLSESSVYILVLTGRDDMQRQDAEYWLRLIHSFARDSADKTAPVIIALNKSSSAPFKLNRNALMEKYPFIVGFIETDCESGLGIAALHGLLLNTIAAMPIIHHKFKRAWWNIKEALETQTCNYLPYSHFQDICTQHQETDPNRQRFLADVFHALGVALNYGNDPRLRDATVLKPHWVTDGIYKLLVQCVPEDGKARLTMDAVRKMLPDDNDEMQRYLVELMLRFNLAFPLRRRADHPGCRRAPRRPNLGANQQRLHPARLARHPQPLVQPRSKGGRLAAKRLYQL